MSAWIPETDSEKGLNVGHVIFTFWHGVIVSVHIEFSRLWKWTLKPLFMIQLTVCVHKNGMFCLLKVLRAFTILSIGQRTIRSLNVTKSTAQKELKWYTNSSQFNFISFCCTGVGLVTKTKIHELFPYIISRNAINVHWL